MSSAQRYTVNLFYSYSHLDTKYRERMEKALALLRNHDHILDDWSDHRILPGQNITTQVHQKLKSTDVIVFLASPNFIASDECLKELYLAEEIAKKRPSIVRIPIILSDCAWKDIENISTFKALPRDAMPIDEYRNADKAWQEVYEGIKLVVEKIRKTFSIKPDFRQAMQNTGFFSQEHINLQDIFVFPTLSLFQTNEHGSGVEVPITNAKELLKRKHVLVHGEQLCGKSALCRYMVLTLVKRSDPVIYVDLNDTNGRTTEEVFRVVYERQFNGDFGLWKEQANKTVVLDNLSSSPHAINLVVLATKLCERVIVALSTENFFAYFRDDDRLAHFRAMEINPLTHNEQALLIKNRIELTGADRNSLYGKIDSIENRINAVIINKKIVPRYPFYVLSILQSYESYMPTTYSITSYSHCYYVLIVAHLVKSGISKADDDINSCFNFLERLAFLIFQNRLNGDCDIGADALNDFVDEYQQDYILKESIISRLKHVEYGILSSVGEFRTPYMYYFFLGRYLAKNSTIHEKTIKDVLDRSYTTENARTLIFMIHHTDDLGIIDEILIRTMLSLDSVCPSVLDEDEAKVFEGALSAIPTNILSERSVERERRIEREKRDRQEDHEAKDDLVDDDDNLEEVNQVYRIMKNNEILAHILKNRYGSLKHDRLVEIIETIADGGLRLVRLLTSTQQDINEFASLIHKDRPDISIEKIRRAVRLIVFGWTMTNIEKIVGSLNKPEIRSVVDEVVEKNSTPAYDLIGYFLRLDTMEQFSDQEYEILKKLLDKYRYLFIRRVLSLRTQLYLNTHVVHAPMEQSVCSLLKIPYRPRLKSGV